MAGLSAKAALRSRVGSLQASLDGTSAALQDSERRLGRAGGEAQLLLGQLDQATGAVAALSQQVDGLQEEGALMSSRLQEGQRDREVGVGGGLG